MLDQALLSSLPAVSAEELTQICPKRSVDNEPLLVVSSFAPPTSLACWLSLA